jgi:hypothetical protein
VLNHFLICFAKIIIKIPRIIGVGDKQQIAYLVLQERAECHIFTALIVCAHYNQKLSRTIISVKWHIKHRFSKNYLFIVGYNTFDIVENCFHKFKSID